MSGRQTHEIVHPPGDAAAVLVYHSKRRTFVLVRQFRIATVRDELPGEGWLTELPAGRIDGSESPCRCARRELEQETGYAISDSDTAKDLECLNRFEHIATVYPTAGLATERIFIYFVAIDDRDDAKRKPPRNSPEEDTCPVEIGEDDLFDGLDKGAYTDAKLIIAAQWFRTTRKRDPAMVWRPEIAWYRFTEDTNKDKHRVREIGIVSGDILDVRRRLGEPIDIWVNSENTDMLMDRFFGRSISATIRFHGADKYHNNTIYRDTIHDELRSKLGGNLFVAAGSVFDTGSGELLHNYGVRRIFHVAAVQGRPGQGLYADPKVSADCVGNALQRAQALNTSFFTRFWSWLRFWQAPQPYKSILIPLLGAGQGQRKAHEIARAIVPAAVTFMQRNPDAILNRVCFLGFTEREYALLNEAIQPLVKDKVLEPADAARAGGA